MYHVIGCGNGLVISSSAQAPARAPADSSAESRIPSPEAGLSRSPFRASLEADSTGILIVAAILKGVVSYAENCTTNGKQEETSSDHTNGYFSKAYTHLSLGLARARENVPIDGALARQVTAAHGCGGSHSLSEKQRAHLEELEVRVGDRPSGVFREAALRLGGTDRNIRVHLGNG